MCSFWQFRSSGSPRALLGTAGYLPFRLPFPFPSRPLPCPHHILRFLRGACLQVSFHGTFTYPCLWRIGFTFTFPLADPSRIFLCPLVLCFEKFYVSTFTFPMAEPSRTFTYPVLMRFCCFDLPAVSAEIISGKLCLLPVRGQTPALIYIYIYTYIYIYIYIP